ncbi:MAG TPA: MBL fold metallo-hydrolase [Longimicrobiales bacterium]|jgi:phosphoribosyl 1,2-cyclic phosphate phosphodiesterase
MKLTFLGTGTSFGVPVVGCRCDTCTSKDPRDRRTRNAALVRLDGGTVLVDTPPELRLQLLAADVEALDAVWITHGHADHIHGIDDLRVFTFRGRSMPTYVSDEHIQELHDRFPYIFDPAVQPAEGTTKPRVELRSFRSGEPVQIAGAAFMPVAVPHGATTVYGFRVGELGYVTDGKCLPPEAVRALEGVRVLVLNALWFGQPHPTHFNVEEAVEAARAVGARQTYLIHLTHRVSHKELERRLPPGVAPAYDGLTVEV